MKLPACIGCAVRNPSVRSPAQWSASLALTMLAVSSCRAPETSTEARKAQPRDPNAPTVTNPAKPAATAAASAGPAAKEDPSPLAPVESRSLLSGTLASRWRMRRSGDARDQDLYGVLAFEVGDSARDRVSGRFLGRLSADIDGRGSAENQQSFSSLQDTHGKAAHFDLYEASVDIKEPFAAPLRARLGRQIDYATPEFAHFDGLRVESEPIGRSKFVAGAYGGVPVRFYEATSIQDQLVGAWTEARPWTGGRVRADWMHVHQDAEPSDYYDDLLGLAVWQRLGESLRVDARYTRLESEDRDVRLGATWQDGHGDLLVQAGYYRLLNPLRDFASEFDPFYATLQQFEPYDQYRLLVSKTLGRHLRLDLGGDLRRLDDADDEGRLNHDYERGYATLVVSDLPAHGLDLSLTGDSWNSDDQDVRTWGVDLTWKPNTSWRLSAGSAYALYKFDVVLNEERDDVRTWYARARKVLNSSFTIDLEYDYENADSNDYQEILAGATWHF